MTGKPITFTDGDEHPYVVTPTTITQAKTQSLGIEAMSNGSYRVTVNGAGISASQRADLVENMQNWGNPAANAPGASNQQRYCGKK
ncbi:MAG: hypothetical protein KGL25_02760 [Gammaproteobacteria bacterium]|nr:hypothetical protein [Gammaproteobacteria bacterium]